MKTSIYISDRRIHAVTGNYSGKLNIKGYYHVSLPDDLIINGDIMDTSLLASRLSLFFDKHKLDRNNVSLVLNAESALMKIINVPIMPANKLFGLIRGEFGISENNNGYVFDYTVVNSKLPGGGGRIFAVALERNIVEKYKKLFSSANINLKGMDIIQSCAMNFFRSTEEYKRQSFIFSLLDGNQIISMLFDNDEYIFSNKVTLYEDRGTPAAAVEISRTISSMVQYNYARNTRTPLNNIYISGLMGEEPQFYDDMKEALSINVGPLEKINGSDNDYGIYLFCMGDIVK